MREADRRTIEEIGLPGAVLMENAGERGGARRSASATPRRGGPRPLRQGQQRRRRLRGGAPACATSSPRCSSSARATTCGATPRLHLGPLEKCGGHGRRGRGRRRPGSGRGSACGAPTSSWTRCSAPACAGRARRARGGRDRGDRAPAASWACPSVAVDIPRASPPTRATLPWPAVPRRAHRDLRRRQVRPRAAAGVRPGGRARRRRHRHPARRRSRARSPTCACWRRRTLRAPSARARPARTRATSATCWWSRARWGRRGRPSSPARRRCARARAS